jgi:hypothetical protein
MRERIYTEEMVLPPFFIIKGLTSEFSREGTVSVGDKSYLTPSYHLAKSSIYDGGFEAIHATNIYSGADSTEEGKVCLGSDIALLLYREHRDLVGPFEGLLSAEKFFHIFFTSSQKNLDLHANPAFHYSFGFSDFVSDDEDDEDEGNDVGSLRPRIFEEGTYNPAWFWRNAIEHWDTSMYTDHVSDLPTFRSYVSDETTFCINTAQHCVYLFLEDETIPPFENILFQGRVGSEIGCILVVVKK